MNPLVVDQSGLNMAGGFSGVMGMSQPQMMLPQTLAGAVPAQQQFYNPNAPLQTTVTQPQTINLATMQQPLTQGFMMAPQAGQDGTFTQPASTVGVTGGFQVAAGTSQTSGTQQVSTPTTQILGQTPATPAAGTATVAANATATTTTAAAPAVEQQPQQQQQQPRRRKPKKVKPSVFVGGLRSDITERELRNFFGVWGKINHVTIKDGFSFLDYADEASALACVEKTNGYIYDGKPLGVRIQTEDNRRTAQEAKRNGENVPLLFRRIEDGANQAQAAQRAVKPASPMSAQPLAAAPGAPAPGAQQTTIYEQRQAAPAHTPHTLAP